MAKVKVLNLEKIRSDIRKKIALGLRDEEIRKGIGEIIVQDIKETKDFGTPAESTIKWRERYEKSNTTDEFYNRNKLNATFTGELLEDLKNNVRLNSTKGAIAFEITQSSKFHKPYKSPSKKTKSRSKSNVTRPKYSDIQNWMINNYGYNYLKIEDFTVRKLVAFIRNTLEKILVK
jgi:hypothetical protein